MRAGMRTAHREAAMVTDQTLAKAMIDQPGIADGTGEAVPAGAAKRERRIAAAVEEQKRLFAPFDCKANLFRQSWRDEAAARRRFAAQVNRLDMRHVRPAEPRRQRNALIAALARVDFGFDRRRG